MLIIDNWIRDSVETFGLDIFAESNQGDLSSQELLTRLYFVAVGVHNVYGLSTQPKQQRQEISIPGSAPVTPKYELPPKIACFEFQVF